MKAEVSMVCNFYWYILYGKIWLSSICLTKFSQICEICHLLKLLWKNCFSESRVLHWYLSKGNSIKLLTEIKLKVLLGMQTKIMDSTLATSSSFGAIPRLSCWPEHKQLYGTNPTETNIRSWQTFATTHHMNFKTKHLLYKISQWVAFQLVCDVIFLF